MSSFHLLRCAAVCSLLGLIGSVCLAQTADTVGARPLPVEAFFAPDLLPRAVLSPNGRWLAAEVARPGERVKLVVSDLEDKEPARVVATFSRHDVQDVQWLNDEILVFGVDDPQASSHEQRKMGRGLMSVQRNGENIRVLIKREWKWGMEFGRQGGTEPLEAHHALLALGPVDRDELLVGERKFDASGQFASWRLLKLNARTGARSSLVDNPPSQVQQWWFDPQGTPRLAMSSEAGMYTLHWHDTEAKRWREVARFPWLNPPYWPAFIDGEGRLYVTQQDDASRLSHLSRLDPETGQMMGEPLASVQGFSGGMDGLLDRRSGELHGLGLLTDGQMQIWLSPVMKALQAQINAALPGRINLLRCHPCDQPRMLLVHSYSDQHPGEYFSYDVAAKRLQRLGARRPAIDPSAMARLAFHRIPARDNADLPMWVTLPPGAGAQPRPAVVLVHGGPWVRGAEWAWNAESQFLASRGYVVIQPEFRGSTGYGYAHFRAGWRQWGQAMQDDVTDALRFAIGKGWVDGKRVCIAGASYGGYATLMGLAKDPDLYRCGVAWIGVTDPRLMFSLHWSDIRSDTKQYTMPQMIGDPVKDAAMLAANAPLELAAKIKAPVMLAYGQLDMRVPIAHGERMRAMLIEAGNPPEWHVYNDEGHGWQRPENMLDFWRRVERFLARHLAP